MADEKHSDSSSEYDSDSEEEIDEAQRIDEPNLSSQICHAFETSTFDDVDSHFLPEDCIEKLITEQAIRRELKAGDGSALVSDEESQLIKWIHSGAKKVFAITVLCSLTPPELLQSMERFKTTKFKDDKLPIEDPRDSKYQRPRYFRTKDRTLNLVWHSHRLYTFWDHQWKFLTPVFDQKVYDYDLQSHCIFPFVNKAQKANDGAFSIVYKVKIHQAHQNYGQDEVAVKKIRLNRGADQAGVGLMVRPKPAKEEVGQIWEKEAMSLASINLLDHEHVIKCLSAIRRGDHRYFMFPWANGGCLRDFWTAIPEQTPSAYIIEQTVTQLRGLAEALFRLHNFESQSHLDKGSPPPANIPDVRVGGELVFTGDADEGLGWSTDSIRHGDLKPENILRFLNNHSNTYSNQDLGILKLADMGLAKRHVVQTGDRGIATSTRFGTAQYEAPETRTELEARSRLYDIWSMGCIVFEFVIWILYGNNELNNFYKQAKGNAQEMQFFEIRGDGNGAEVHRVVRQWMNHIRKNDPECLQTSAIQDLLELVRTKLLVVDLPPRRPSSLDGPSGPPLQPPLPGERKRNYRASAQSLLESLEIIQSRLGNANYVLTGKSRANVKPPVALSSGFLSTASAQRRESTSRSSTPPLVVRSPDTKPLRTTRADYTLPPLKGWVFEVDNTFADVVLRQAGIRAIIPSSSVAVSLCDRCKDLNFWTGGFAIEDHKQELQEKSKTCGFCQMLWKVYTTVANDIKGSRIRFERDHSMLRLSGSQSLPVLSFFRSPESNPPAEIQLGFPELLKPGSDPFFQLVRLWLQDCDENHEECKSSMPDWTPTRLIDVGTTLNPTLCLLDTKEDKLEPGPYIALSHPWGDPIKHRPFMTLTTNIKLFRKKIPGEQLPSTFRDAVKTTRALGVRYLWIDSLCIIQGNDGDFSEEAKHMENVFSCASCVIAASRATGQHDGFLKDHAQREYVTFQRNQEKPFYVCQNIDNFSHDVLEGSLNRRGWVLQERALARRTVFFAETQTYFECGKGVRCGTLSKMHNHMADLLGDSKFPDKAMNSPRGLKIRYFQDLYKQYSRLEFTHIQDKPFAIAGVESRLRKAYGVTGGYGIFDDGPGKGLFHRSILWRRGDDQPSHGLSPISFPAESRISVPSWSWMAYQGCIDYLDPLFEKTDWEKNDISPPWTGVSNANSAAGIVHPHAGTELRAIARNYDVRGSAIGDHKLVYDSDLVRSDVNFGKVQCVVIAKSKDNDGMNEQEKICYVILVVCAGQNTNSSADIYRRVGAGYMLGKYIALDRAGTPITIR